MDNLMKSTEKASTGANIRRLEHGRTDRRGNEPCAPASEPVENRVAIQSASEQKAKHSRRREGSKRSLLRQGLFALLPLALIAGGYLYVTGGAAMETDNAYVQADTVGISTDVSGMVQQVLVTDNEKVSKGDVLFKLDPKPFRLALERAEAQVGNTRNDLLAMQASYRNMEAQVQQAKADVDFNMTNFKRQEQLLTNNFTPRATYDAAKNTLQSCSKNSRHSSNSWKGSQPI